MLCPKGMVVIVCLDDKNGMMFNGRRQSQDRCLRERIIGMTADKVLRMNQYSAGQFDLESICCAMVGDSFLEDANEGEYCFVENEALEPYEKNIEMLIVFRWNRIYPSDVCLDLVLDGSLWKLIETEEFPGYSHDVITMEVYKK